ncbi:MAG: class I SAM-dependent methyltransferase [Desulfobacterales bacterium]|nr:class I SAM-dependent methyltransferase [Desulfobacterales bacterium]
MNWIGDGTALSSVVAAFSKSTTRKNLTILDPKEYEIMYRAEQSHWWYQGMAAISRSLLETFCAPGAGLRILDAGCGTGAGLLLLSGYGSVTGLDISAHALRFCAERGCIEIGRASVMALPFREGTFDLVTSFDILYFEGVHDEKALREAARVLRPGGRLLIRVPAFDWLRGTHDARVSTAHRYTSRELSGKLARSGFEVEFISYANMILFPFALLKRFSERWLSAQKDSDLALNPGGFSGFLRGCLVLESRLIPKCRFPFGLSVIAVARKVQQ